MRDTDLVVVCTGSQGEPSSALQRMSNGEHRHVKLKEQDTVILSSTPIPYSGNDAKIRVMVDELFKKGVHVFRHETREVDGIGPLHVSGHASREEYADMINMLKPKFFVPIYGDFTAKRYHIDIAIEQGIPRASTLNVDNGQVIAFTPDKMELAGEVPHGTILVDQTGAIVTNVVIKDRVLLSEEGLVAVVLTVDKKTGALLTSPDIISRGFIYMRDNEEIMNGLRIELKRAVQQRFKRIDLDRFKVELKEHITHYLFEHTQRSPIVIPVINVISGGGGANAARAAKQGQGDPNKQASQQPGPGQPSGPPQPAEQPKTIEELAAEQQKRFKEMRARLLTQDPRTD
jgi:ribonuclease J